MITPEPGWLTDDQGTDTTRPHQAIAGIPLGHVSDSAVQRTAEGRILELAGQMLGLELVHRPWAEARMTLPGGARVDVDGYCADPAVFAEVFARQGRLKPGQVHQVAQDILKLVTILRCLAPAAQLNMVFADSAAAAKLSGRSLPAEASREWSVQTLVVDLDPELRFMSVSRPICALCEQAISRSGGTVDAGRRFARWR